jgi:Tfp pilus assembly protein PilE
MRAARRGIGRTEVLIGVAVVAVLGLIAVPLVLSMGKKSARQEVPLLVDSIREFEFAYQEPFGEFVSAEPAPRAPHEVDENPVPWKSNAGFDKLGWAPADVAEVYGSYRVAATSTGFKVIGTCDVDGDGERAVYEATDKEPATAKTDASVY